MEPDPGTDPPSYRAAAEELEQILSDLDDDHLDVDVLAGKVRRASRLIAFCRDRISAARMEVEQVVADLDPPSQPVRSAEPAWPSAPTGDDAPTRLADDRTGGGRDDDGDDPTLVTEIDRTAAASSSEDDPTLLADRPVRTSDRSDPPAPAGS